VGITGKPPWWRQATALVTVSASGAVTGLAFVPGTAGAVTAPAAVPPLHLLALDQAAHPGAAAGDAQVRTAIVNIARHYLQLAKTHTPAQMEALIWGRVSSDGADHGPSCAAFASLTLGTPGSRPASPRPASAVTTAYVSPARTETVRPAAGKAAGGLAVPASAGAALAAGAGLAAARRRSARYAGPPPISCSGCGTWNGLSRGPPMTGSSAELTPRR
jgi:hypothetical protein